LAEVSSVTDDLTITLSGPYGGATGTGGVVSNWLSVTGSGGSISTNNNSSVVLSSGVTSGAATYLQRNGDYLPYTCRVYCAVSQRIIDQQIMIGLASGFSATPSKAAWLVFQGTNSGEVALVTASSVFPYDVETTIFALPNGKFTEFWHLYQVDLSSVRAGLSVDGVPAVPIQPAENQNQIHVPGPYDKLGLFLGIINTAVPLTSTNVLVDMIFFNNVDRLQIESDFQNEPIPVAIPSTITTAFQKYCADDFGTAQPVGAKLQNGKWNERVFDEDASRKHEMIVILLTEIVNLLAKGK
jgi:hypothetical protein